MQACHCQLDSQHDGNGATYQLQYEYWCHYNSAVFIT